MLTLLKTLNEITVSGSSEQVAASGIIDACQRLFNNSNEEVKIAAGKCLVTLAWAQQEDVLPTICTSAGLTAIIFMLSMHNITASNYVY